VLLDGKAIGFVGELHPNGARNGIWPRLP
jgi:hypothetical protein